MIDWSSNETHLLLNPRMPAEERERLETLVESVPSLRAHVWLATSGTTGALRLVALGKEAMLASAVAVNAHVGATASDTWCCVLPTFHVGGLGIYARAALTGARVVAAEWDAQRFASLCVEERVAFASLVPAQVSDLVRARVQAPEGLRAAIVGGGAFHLELAHVARELGWPVVPSYGMTECCSQVATASVGSDELVVLPHLEVREEAEGRLAVRGASLLTGYAFFDPAGRAVFGDPRRGGWFVSDDLGRVEGRVLHVRGRSGEFVKIGGESVELRRLDAILDAVRGEADAAIVAIPEPRLGHVINVAIAGPADVDTVVSAFNERVLPFERIREAHRVSSIPRSPLGKLLRGRLLEEVQKAPKVVE